MGLQLGSSVPVFRPLDRQVAGNSRRSICVFGGEVEEQMFAKGARLNYTALWLVAAITGLVENWLLRSFGLNITERTVVGLGFVPLLAFLALTCSFQQVALQRK
jgi:hypothetical protein